MYNIFNADVKKTKNRLIRQENVPYLGQLSVRSTRKMFGYKKLQGTPNRLLDGAKKFGDFFFFSCGAPNKLTGGAPDGNVTPFLNANHLWVKLYMVK